MKPELLARILKIIEKTEEKVIICDPISEVPFVIMGLDSYEKIAGFSQILAVKTVKPEGGLTQNPEAGKIDPDLALLKESRNMIAGEWGGDEKVEDDQYYMEPAE